MDCLEFMNLNGNPGMWEERPCPSTELYTDYRTGYSRPIKPKDKPIILKNGDIIPASKNVYVSNGGTGGT